MKVLKLTGADEHDIRRFHSRKWEGKAKGDLTLYTVMKHFVEHLLLGVLPNTTLERVELKFPPWLSGHIKCELLFHCCTSFISAVANIAAIWLLCRILIPQSLSRYAFGTQHENSMQPFLAELICPHAWYSQLPLSLFC